MTTGREGRPATSVHAALSPWAWSTDALVRGFAAMSKTVGASRDAWKEMGVHIDTNRDGSVDAYRTFQNLRQAISATGGSLLSTAAAHHIAPITESMPMARANDTVSRMREGRARMRVVLDVAR